jgi:glycosyltransferase-like protein
MNNPTQRAAPGLRIALLTHSTNPRGGVVHAIELGDALQALGQQVSVVAPDPGARGLFRATRCRYEPVPAAPCGGGLAALVRQRIGEYVAWFKRPEASRYDIYHAQDSISANALAVLAQRELIPGFVRTVHHLDHFDDPELDAWQRRGYQDATTVLCVSRLWQRTLAQQHGVDAAQVDNGVDMARFTPPSAATVAGDIALRRRLMLGDGPVFLAVGGVEARKNTVAILQAFLRVRRVSPGARLVVAGGASLLDHSAYASRFLALAQEAGIAPGPESPVTVLGRVADVDMPRLYRCADALVFASLREGFGLAVLEAMACGTPAVVSRIPPFTEYLPDDACAWADPEDPASIAAAMATACNAQVASRLRAAGRAVAADYTWSRTARQHLDIYRSIHSSTGTRHA